MKAHAFRRLMFSMFTFTWVLVNGGPAQTSTSRPEALPLVSPMFGHNMVLQRDKPNTIWGWAGADKEIKVVIGDQSVTAKPGVGGRWQVQFTPPPAGGPYLLTISGPEKVVFTNILVGDVWICGGQSNMEWPLGLARNGGDEIKAADHPNIRLFNVKQQPAYAPAAVPQGSWKICSPKTVTEDGGVSAVGYFFARKIRSETNVPIGLIKDCWGGTPAESWTSPETLRTLKDFDEPLNEVERLRAKGGTAYGNYVSHWYDEYDAGQKGRGWAAPEFNDSDWKPVSIPGGFRELGVPETPAVCYFRKSITLPNPLPPGKVTLHLGIIERMDTAYINGQWVGASAWVESPRTYGINEGILKPGPNVVTVRVFKLKPDGGFRSNAGLIRLVLGDKSEIPLAGEWKGKLSVDARPPHPLPLGYENWPVMPGVLHQGMIAPVAPLAICGAIWYQGESNAGRSYQYRTLLPAMIADWRQTFGQGDFPFYIVSLSAFMQRRDTPGDDGWAELREAQALAARSVPHSGLAVTIDVGDANDVHPKDKKEVGERLALCALANHYGKKIPFAGPTFASLEKLPGALKLHFNHCDGGLVVKGEKLGEFAVAGEDRKWHWAEARIEGNAVIVSSPKVAEPKAARYAWQSNPLATLYNGAGLPAVPFRTDIWPGVTDKAKPW